MNRRNFIKTGLAGFAGIAWMNSGANHLRFTIPESILMDKVQLGNTGLNVSRIALGTGTRGFDQASDQTRMGMEKFVQLAHHAYKRGINFFDMADIYGSHSYVGNALKSLPREKVVVLSKIWPKEEGSGAREPVEKTLDRFRMESHLDYFDILLIHCMMSGNWHQTYRFYMDALSKAKQKGIVKAVGISCHHIDALSQAAENPWVDVIMARINPFGTFMDGKPEEVKKILDVAKKNGKAIIGMKIFGQGNHVSDEERQQSLQFALTEVKVHAMTIGFDTEAQIDDTVERVNLIVQ